MTLQDCYAAMNGNYDEVLGRLRSERLIHKFVLKFLADGSYELLQRSLAEGNQAEAFRAAHTLKGVCQNLGITQLGDSSSRLTETLRANGTPPQELLAEVTRDYNQTVQAIRAFEAEL